MADFDDGFDFNTSEDTDDGFGDFFNEETNSDNTDSGFGDFGGGQQQTVNEASNGKSAVLKQAIIIAIIGIIIMTLTFGIVKWLTGSKNEPKENVVNPPSQTDNIPQNNVQTNSWSQFSAADNLTFNENYVDSVFTVTSINHYVKVVDSEKNLMVKTVLTGTLSGFVGTYEIEVPYSKGSLLSIENYFNVEVQIGNFNGKKVVGEIRY